MFKGKLAGIAVCIWLCLVCFQINLKVWLYDLFNTDLASSTQNTNTRSHIKTVVQNTSFQKKVLLFCYMRGGSTFFSELFRQNKEALFWYEPYDAFYDAYFGQITFHLPADIFWYQHSTGNSTIRPVPGWETRMLLDFSQRLLTCNFSGLPPELFTHTAVSFSSLGPLKYCINSKAKEKHVEDCRTPILDKCSGNIAKSITNNCPHDILRAINWTTPQQEDIDNVQVSSDFLDYAKCRKDFANDFIKDCLPELELRCKSKRLVVLKALRLNTETVSHILDKDPNVSVLYLVRDPRSIISSRVDIGYTYRDSYNAPVLEAKYLCQRMLHDLYMFSKLQKLYPNSLKMIKYEDLVRRRSDIVQEVYTFLDISVHESLDKWLKTNSQTQPEKDEVFSTARKNSFDSIVKWGRKIPIHQHKKLNDKCREVLNILDYKT